jgi:recombination protein RecT
MTAELVPNAPMATPDIRTQLKAMEPEFASVLPEGVKPEHFTRVVLTAIQKTPELLKTERKSFLAACMFAAQDGLLPDGREGVILPYGSNAQWLPMVYGVIKRVLATGEVISIMSRPVYEKETFEHWVDESGSHFKHTPKLTGDRGKFSFVYATATTKNGGKFFEVMTLEEIEKVRSKSKAKFGPWTDWFDEMAEKTVIKRMAKRMPFSSNIAAMLSREDEIYDVTPEKKPYIANEYLPGVTPKKTIAQFIDENRKLPNASEVFLEVLKNLEGEPAWYEKFKTELIASGFLPSEKHE